MASSQLPSSTAASAGAGLAAAAGAGSGAAGADRPNQFDFGRGRGASFVVAALARRSSHDSSLVRAHAHASSRCLHVLQCAGGGPRGVRLRKKKLIFAAQAQWLAARLATNPGLPDSHRCSSKRSKMNYSSRSSNGVD